MEPETVGAAIKNQQKVITNMAYHLNKAWRLIATGISFGLFGLGGLVLSFLVIPVVYFTTKKGYERERRVKSVIHHAFHLFINCMYVMGVLTYDVKDYEALNEPGQLILANHPSLLDVVFLIAFIKRADCVVKSSLLSNPFTMGAMRMAGYIANENPEQVVLQAAESLKRGNSLIIFPEGTRTTPSLIINKMKRGAANIALEAKVPITPVIIHCYPTTLTKQHRWYNIPHKRFHLELLLREKLSIEQFQQEPVKSIASRKLTRFLEHYFTKELAKHE